MPAKFKAEASFTAPGRGLVVTGDVLEGIVRAGMAAKFPAWPDELVIDHVGLVRRLDGKDEVGLVFSKREQAALMQLRALSLRDQIVEIRDARA